jgi:hypothetical protein
VLVAIALGGCRVDKAAPPPSAEFLLASGDSTFWVHSGPQGVRVRRSPLVLTSYNGRFYEVYVADDDRSFFDATFLGQRIYRRDLLTNDSTIVYDDPVVPSLAAAYARKHPEAHALEPSEEGSENPSTVVTTEAEIIDVLGPLLTFEHHADIDIDDGDESHETRRGVIDLERGRTASLASLFGDSTASRLAIAGRHAFEQTLDSVRLARDERGRRAAETIDQFTFDLGSFSLTVSNGQPAVEFLVPGRGERAGGLALPLPPLTVPPGAWWRDVSHVLPSVFPDSDTDEWHGNGYDVVARYDSTGERVTLSLRDSARREWSLGHFPAPAQRLYRIDTPQLDSVTRRAIARAFDESVLYSDQARTASWTAPRPPSSASRHDTHRTHRPGISTRDVSHDDARGRKQPRSRLWWCHPLDDGHRGRCVGDPSRADDLRHSVHRPSRFS